MVAFSALAFDSSGNLYAGGDFTSAGGAGANRIARWDGSNWDALGSGTDAHVSALAADSSGNLYAGGDFATAGSRSSSCIARWTAPTSDCGLSAGGAHTLYAGNMPVTVNVKTPGTLECVSIQRHNKSHPDATVALQTGYFWEILGTDSNGNTASGFTGDLTLPTTFTADSHDKLCRYTGSGWECAATSYTASTVTLDDVSGFSFWAVSDDLLPVAPDASTGKSGNKVLLSWSDDPANSAGYRVSYAQQPYFSLDAPTTVWVTLLPGSTGFSHSGAASNPAHNYFYVVQGVNGAGTRSGPSGNAGVFNFTLAPGVP